LITQVICFSGDNIDYLHERLIEAIVDRGRNLKFGSKDKVKMARECHFTVQVFGGGIKKLINGKVPKGVKFKGEMIKEFQNSFMAEDTNPNDYEYSYPQLIKEWPVTPWFDQLYDIGYVTCYTEYDQMDIAKDILMIDKRDDIQSNRNVGSLLHPYMNVEVNGKTMIDKPCFNWFQVRYNGNNMVSLRFLFRSHDYIGGLWPNLCGLSKAFYELVVKPCGCEIEEIIVTSTSGHVYVSDSQEAELICGIPWDNKTKTAPS
jgi:thymidylate synthase